MHLTVKNLKKIRGKAILCQVVLSTVFVQFVLISLLVICD